MIICCAIYRLAPQHPISNRELGQAASFIKHFSVSFADQGILGGIVSCESFFGHS
jgi:hypothetical protein